MLLYLGRKPKFPGTSTQQPLWNYLGPWAGVAGNAPPKIRASLTCPAKGNKTSWFYLIFEGSRMGKKTRLVFTDPTFPSNPFHFPWPARWSPQKPSLSWEPDWESQDDPIFPPKKPNFGERGRQPTR